MLCFGQRKYPFLPFVISLFTYAIFFTPAFHSQSTVPAFRDSPGPHGQLGLLIQLLQFCAHNKKHPRIADSTRESRILSATIREYCVTLSFCTQAAATFDGYIYAIISEEKPNQKEQIRIKTESLKKYFPSHYSTQQMEKAIIKLLEDRYRSKHRGQER